MRIGIPKESKVHEYRVGATPEMVKSLADEGHTVLVESGAGLRIALSDDMYRAAGAKTLSCKEVWDAEMVIKVKEPQKSEYPFLRRGQIIFCFLHLAPDPEQTRVLLEKEVIGIAYETVTDLRGGLPLLIPMSEMAGRISIQAGGSHLQLNCGGRGVLLGGVPGVLPANVLIVGGGIVGTEAARMALGLGANVTIIDKDLHRLRNLSALFGHQLRTLYSTAQAIEEQVRWSDLVIGSVLIPGKSAPKLITEEMVEQMMRGSVIVDVAIDQGGCVATSRPTTHADPAFIKHGVVHYCVTNMPGACAQTATRALTNATMPYALAIAKYGAAEAMRKVPGLIDGLNVYLGAVTNRCVAEDLGLCYLAAEDAFKKRI